MHGSPWRRVWRRNEGSWVLTASTCIPMLDMGQE